MGTVVGPTHNLVTAAVTLLLRLCYGSDLNFAPILPMCYGCYGSRGGKEVSVASPRINRVVGMGDLPTEKHAVLPTLQRLDAKCRAVHGTHLIGLRGKGAQNKKQK
jgi:hypothetical protein